MATKRQISCTSFAPRLRDRRCQPTGQLRQSGGAMEDHPDRHSLSNEFHARPFAFPRAPEQASYFAMLSSGIDSEDLHAYLIALCGRFGTAHPPAVANHFSADLGPCRLKWERHTEFISYTFLRHGAVADAFDRRSHLHRQRPHRCHAGSPYRDDERRSPRRRRTGRRYGIRAPALRCRNLMRERCRRGLRRGYGPTVKSTRTVSVAS